MAEGAARCAICRETTQWQGAMPETCPNCGARGGMRTVRVTSARGQSVTPKRGFTIPQLARSLDEALRGVAPDDSRGVD